MNKNKLSSSLSLLGAVIMLLSAEVNAQGYPHVRVDVAHRNFVSPVIEQKIDNLQKSIHDPELAWMFGNCFPNTLDRTVNFSMKNGKPNTFVITGILMPCGCAIVRHRFGLTCLI